HAEVHGIRGIAAVRKRPHEVAAHVEKAVQRATGPGPADQRHGLVAAAAVEDALPATGERHGAGDERREAEDERGESRNPAHAWAPVGSESTARSPVRRPGAMYGWRGRRRVRSRKPRPSIH